MSPVIAALAASGAALILLVAIRGLGLWLAATHPEPETSVASEGTGSVGLSAQPQGVLAAVIAAAVHATLKRPVRVISVIPVQPPSVESLMLQWSVEGRRAIYSSHRVR